MKNIRTLAERRQNKMMITVTLINILVWGAVALSLFMAASNKGHDHLTTEEAFSVLDQSVVEYTYAVGENMCSATMIGENTYISAAHCKIDNLPMYIVNDDLDFVAVDRVDASVTRDWMIIYTKEDVPGVVPIAVSCSTDPWYIGMPVAYLGYPWPLDRYYSEGIIVNLEYYRGVPEDHPLNIPLTSLNGGPGSSGSGIIDLRTGELIGVLSTGLPGSRGHILGVGITPITEIPQCGLEGGGIRG
jgi:hypothetical protein